MKKIDVNRLERKHPIIIGYSYLMCLPKEWIYEHSITKNSKIQLEILDNGKIILTPIKNGNEKDLIEMEKFIKEV